MANWLNLKKLEDWEFPMFQGFQYDHIEDATIASALADFENLAQVDPLLDWEDDHWLSENQNIPDEHKHAYRVAALVHQFQHGHPMQHGISLDTFLANKCCSCIPNGHHRIRALQFLGVNIVPFELGGSVKTLEQLLQLAGEPNPSPETQKYFSQQLLTPSSDDFHP